MISATIQKDILKPEGFHSQSKSLLLASLAINILSLAVPIMTLQVYDRILPNVGSGTLPILLAGVFIAIVLEAALRLTRAYVIGWNGATYEHRMSCKAMNHILQSNLSRVGPVGIGEHMSRMAAIGKLKDFYNGYGLVTLSELVFVPVFLGLIAYIGGPLIIVPSVILILFMVLSLWQGRKLRNVLDQRGQIDDERYNFLIESLEGIHTIKSFAMENAFSRRYEALEETSTLANYAVTDATASTFNTGAVFSHLMVTCVIVMGAIFVLQGHLTTGGLIATIILSGRIMQPIQRTLGLWAGYQDFSIAREKANALFATPLHIPPEANTVNPPREGTLQINHLSFRFADDQPWILENINIDIKARECILLDTDQASSKSILLKVLSGIYPPTQGQIRVDGTDIQYFAAEQLVHHVGYIQTEGLIFRGSIRDNLTCFGQIDESHVREIASLLKVDRDIAKLSSGFDTYLSGNHTDSITPGLKQRIAMVRVLATKPRIILFDNADRSLDHQGYNTIYKLLAQLKGKATMILISDDQNLRNLADRFCRLQGSKLIETNDSENAPKVQPYQELRI